MNELINAVNVVKKVLYFSNGKPYLDLRVGSCWACSVMKQKEAITFLKEVGQFFKKLTGKNIMVLIELNGHKHEVTRATEVPFNCGEFPEVEGIDFIFIPLINHEEEEKRWELIKKI